MERKFPFEPVCDAAEDFKNGVARVKLKDKWIYIDKTVKEVVSPKG